MDTSHPTPPGPGGPIRGRIEALLVSPDEVARRVQRIRADLLRDSRTLAEPNFRSISIEDLRALFDAYDREFFRGDLSALIRSDQGDALSFRLSNRMTSAAGKTFLSVRRDGRKSKSSSTREFQIAISTLLMFQTFRDIDRTITVCGTLCHDRLEALQRVFEHELVHLIEFALTNDSTCSGPFFQRLARNIFAHRDIHHDLITPQEAAERQYFIRPGQAVRFRHEGRSYVGVVNRITRRATVLVSDPAGRLFSDGGRYLTFYVPLNALEPARTVD